MESLEWYRVVVCAAILIMAAVNAVPRFRFAAIRIVALVGFGVLQDQISTRLCPEYFTVLHPPIPGLTNPTLLGIAWGFLGAWWGGALMGYGVGLAATVGPRPQLTPREVVVPLLVLLAVVAATAGLTDVSVWRHAELFDVSLSHGLDGLVPPERHRSLLVVAC